MRKKATIIAWLLAIAFVMAACGKPAAKNETQDKATVKDNTGTVRIYENDLFSIVLPIGWVCDSSGWEGLDHVHNEVDIYYPEVDDGEELVRIHIVKTYFPIQWKNVEEAKEMAKMMRTTGKDDVVLFDEQDGAKVGGYPASVLYFANFIGNDTIIQKQIVTYLQDSHIVVYFNEVFNKKNWDAAQIVGDQMLSYVELKKVKNPLENDSIAQAAAEEEMRRNHQHAKGVNKEAEQFIKEYYIEKGYDWE